ncbi:hypothetical protein [Rhizobium sp. BK176]|uniref:hypothetical protein n=1 Tax=Rhizobium sp. BK176 TaxID=2587071 RepID=UPI00216893B1|nr:hypothetical protein [Rhizobium sp. BK176]MCS4088670.1 hypothetical protein [Rhizobium sp. BK176]
MAGKYDQAEVLLAMATLGTGYFRTDGGRLDRALQSIGDDLPVNLKGLSFGCGSVGLRCFELPDIINAAFFALLADYGPRGDHNTLHSKLSTNEAMEIAIQQGSTIEHFTHVATRLSELANS